MTPSKLTPCQTEGCNNNAIHQYQVTSRRTAWICEACIKAWMQTDDEEFLAQARIPKGVHINDTPTL